MNQDSSLEAVHWLRAFRHKIINLLLGSVALLGALGLLVSFSRVWHDRADGISFTLAYYIGAYVVVLILFFVRQIPDKWRAIGFLALLYIFSILAFYSGWLAGGGRVFLLPLIVLAAILSGARAGVIAAIVSTITYIIFGLSHSQGWLIYEHAPFLDDPAIILIEGLGFAMAVGMISIGVWFFQQSLNAATDAIQETQEARTLLAERAKELDAANQLLAERGQRLETANEELEIQNWRNVGESLLNEALRGEQEISTLADHVLSQLCHYLNFPVGALFILENDILKRVGKYAFPADSQLKDQFKLGEGLIGQAARDKRIITVHKIPPESITISSGLGQSPPVGLLIVPLICNDQVSGVLEFGLPDDDLARKINFLERVMESIAVAFNTAQDRARIDHLLDETQQQAEELQTQEEELRAANEELRAKAEAYRSGRMGL